MPSLSPQSCKLSSHNYTPVRTFSVTPRLETRDMLNGGLPLAISTDTNTIVYMRIRTYTEPSLQASSRLRFQTGSLVPRLSADDLGTRLNLTTDCDKFCLQNTIDKTTWCGVHSHKNHFVQTTKPVFTIAGSFGIQNFRLMTSTYKHIIGVWDSVFYATQIRHFFRHKLNVLHKS